MVILVDVATIMDVFVIAIIEDIMDTIEDGIEGKRDIITKILQEN